MSRRLKGMGRNMLTNIEAVIFDLDGTLVDSMWIWEAIDMEYLKRFGQIPPLDLPDIIGGMSFSETASYFKDRFKIPDTLEQIKMDWNQMAWEKYEQEVSAKVGVKEFLQRLQRKRIKTGVATSNSSDLAKLVIHQNGLDSYLEEIHTSCEVKRGKPAPDIYLLVSEKLQVKPENCLVFEDIVPGIMAAKNAGMKVCGIADAHSLREEGKKKQLADYYIDSFEELLKGGVI